MNIPPVDAQASSELRSARVQSFEGTLYVMSCPECGVQFGAPASLCLNRARDGQAVHCVNGHRFIPADPSVAELHSANGALLDEVATLRKAMALAAGQVSGPLDIGERKRLCRVLANTAPVGTNRGNKTRLCRFCGQGYNGPYNLFRHIWRSHQERIGGNQLIIETPPAPRDPHWLKVSDVARLLGCSEVFIRRLCREQWSARGLAKTVRQSRGGRQWLINRTADTRLCGGGANPNLPLTSGEGGQ